MNHWEKEIRNTCYIGKISMTELLTASIANAISKIEGDDENGQSDPEKPLKSIK